MSTIAHVQTVEEPYLRELSQIESGSSWKTAELLSRWKRETKQTDADIAKAANLNQSHVNRMIRIYEDFGDSRFREMLLFGHFKEALPWDDADMWIREAAQNGWSIRQMTEARNEDASKAPANYALGHKEEPDEQDDEDVEDVEVIDDFVPSDEDIEADEELSQPQHVIPTPPPEPQKPTAPIVPHLQVPFELGTRVSSPAGLLAAVLKELKAIALEYKDDVPQFMNRIPHIETHIKNAIAEVNFVTPTKQCPECGGHRTTAKGQCQRCKGAGWIGKE